MSGGFLAAWSYNENVNARTPEITIVAPGKSSACVHTGAAFSFTLEQETMTRQQQTLRALAGTPSQVAAMLTGSDITAWVKTGPVAFDSRREALDWAIVNIRLSYRIERDGPFWRVEIPACEQ